MKNNLLFLFVVSLLLCAAPASYAGFAVKKSHAIQKSTSFHTAETAALTGVLTASGVQDQDDEHHHHVRKPRPSKSGWEGITAFVCAMCGFGPLGVVFGALGMGKGHKHRGLAIAGFAIGLAHTLVIVIVVTIFAMTQA